MYISKNDKNIFSKNKDELLIIYSMNQCKLVIIQKYSLKHITLLNVSSSMLKLELFIINKIKFLINFSYDFLTSSLLIPSKFKLKIRFRYVSLIMTSEI